MQSHTERRTYLMVSVVGGLLLVGMTAPCARSEPLRDECCPGLRIVPVSATGAHEIVGDTIFLDTGGQRVTLEYRLSGRDPDLDGAPPVPWTDIDPALPDGIVDFSDIPRGVDAFRGLPYPYEAPYPQVKRR